MASAGRDVNLVAAVVANSGAGASAVSAGRDLNLGTVTTASSQSTTWNASNWRQDASRAEVGSTLQGVGNIALQAGRDVSARAATVNSTQGGLTIAAGRDVAIAAGQASQNVDEAHRKTGSSGWLSKKTTTTRDTLAQTSAQASTLSADSVAISAGQDVRLSGSNAVSTRATAVEAQRNVSIEAASHTKTETHLVDEKKSGLFSSGGLSLTLGTQQQSRAQTTTTTTAAGSTVGSTQGSVAINAGSDFRQSGSAVSAPQGDVTIGAQRLAISEARQTEQQNTDTHFKQSGLTVAASNPVLGALQTAQQMKSAATQAADPRMQALAAATTALAAKNAADAVSKDPGSLGGVNLSISIGQSKSESHATQTRDSAAGSTVAAGSDVMLRALGAVGQAAPTTSTALATPTTPATPATPATPVTPVTPVTATTSIPSTTPTTPTTNPTADLTIQGSTVTAGRNLSVQSDGAINLLAAQSTAQQTGSNRSSGASLGVGVALGSKGVAPIGVTASANAGRGQSDGSDLGHTNTQLQAGQQISLQSVTDTTLKGAVAQADQIVAKVGANLSIESQQDSNRYASRQQNLGGSLTVGATSVSGSVNAGQSKLDSTLTSVTQQTALQAGDRGFQVQVQGHTALVGGAVTSTDKAASSGQNTLSTATLSSRDLQNRANFSGQSVSLGVGFSTSTSTSTSTNANANANANASTSTSTSTATDNNKTNPVGKDQQGQAATGAAQTPGSALPSLGGLSATPPIALAASGSAASTTQSAISAGSLTITDSVRQQALTGQDAATVVASINRNLRSGEDGSQALAPIFNAQQIEAKFAIVGVLAREAGTFVVNRAAAADQARQTAKDKDAEADQKAAAAQALPDDQARASLLQQAQADRAAAANARLQAQDIESKWGRPRLPTSAQLGAPWQVGAAAAAGDGGGAHREVERGAQLGGV